VNFPIASTTPANGSVNRFRPVAVVTTVPFSVVVWWNEPVIFRLTCFVGSSRFITVPFSYGEVKIKRPPGISIALPLPCAEMLIRKAHDPKGAPGSTSKVTFMFPGGPPFSCAASRAVATLVHMTATSEVASSRDLGEILAPLISISFCFLSRCEKLSPF